ncbi:tetratricopeptide repeat protein [Thermosynechococcus sichuanensis E542]|uniref:Tetratricopeptide repeat protein n=2 Tax=Thermosynechococcus TaxID=146785 RepID=A0A3B7MCS1_9CYAN|nr:tetratricopeptide repeat protein [Thermosynechococcus vestitus E542]
MRSQEKGRSQRFITTVIVCWAISSFSFRIEVRLSDAKRRPTMRQPLFSALTVLAAFVGLSSAAVAQPIAIATLTPPELQELQRLVPRSAEDYYNVGLMHQGTGDLAAAIDAFSQAIRLNPSADYYFARGLAYYDQGDLQRAIADFTTALRNDPQFIAAYYNRGMAYLALQNYTAAIADFDAALARDAQFVAAYYSRGMAHFDSGNVELAQRDYERARALNPAMTAQYYDRAPRPLTGGP